MFDIRKIQEQVIDGAVKAASDDNTAATIVFGENGQNVMGQIRCFCTLMGC